MAMFFRRIEIGEAPEKAGPSTMSTVFLRSLRDPFDHGVSAAALGLGMVNELADCIFVFQLGTYT